VAAIPNPEKALEEALKQQRASLEKQRQAIHLQIADRREQIGPFSPYPATMLPAPARIWIQTDCTVLAREKVDALIATAAQQQSLDPALLKAVMKQESGFKPCAVSPVGAQGLMQLMPATARELHVKNVFDPQQNVQGGAAYLRQLLERYHGDLRLALVGYNAGPGRADQPDAPYPLETQNYVATILADLGMDSREAATQTEDLAPSEESEKQTPPALPVPAKPPVIRVPPSPAFQ